MGDGTTVVTPDVGFVRSLQEAGADTLKRCYQCATCSVVCELTPKDNPFPRKEMVMAQWGMKDELAKDPDVWLCHNCNDCTKYCPRGARPGDVLSVLRKTAVAENAFPRFMGTIVGNPGLIILALAFPVILFGIFIAIRMGSGQPLFPEGQVVFSKFFPIHYIDPIFITTATLVMLSFVVSVSRFWCRLNVQPYKLLAYGQFMPSLIATIKEIFLHTKFQKCDANNERTLTHRLVFFGFIGLFITTNWGVFNIYVLGWDSPYSLTDPRILALFHGSKELVFLFYLAFKVFGNVSALALLIGGVMIVSNRLKDKGFVSKTSSFDWLFVAIILILAITGLLSEMLRLADVAIPAYTVYFVHLVFVFYIIAYLPFSKLAHLVYRTVAILYSKMALRDVM
ncbi:MAG: quinone-interacting membrane-bound oxidoreductase complex subunit QmoC [Nitrospirae bacterium]|nr:quinone-interacting membrane-bound oxidoreductase complex subunit QmoC [Nitrospirota bacterium]MBF0590523.1 quinone-interacting membrane-bound oxidoreductase complex subunit QmoC [Nitrospirota bacterium]